MGKIKIMSRDLSNRIAAGEVIERPASVVKELVENAIDAQAKRIFIAIERAGTKLILVRDDGCGMSEEDASLALQPHGTSKLTDLSDLEKIATLGFRGEALPSIASVSRFTLRTREPGAPAAVKVIQRDDGEFETVPDGAPAGTSIEVRDLFYNTPARKKFLKSPATEEHHIEEAVLTLALGHPEVGFELKIGSRIAFSLAPGSTVEMRIRELFGKNYGANLLPVQHRENTMVIRGFVGAPGFTRPSRKEQRVFINTRAVESPAVYRGIRDGYGTLLSESGRFPPAILYLEMDPSELDVNVHPAKREVRFHAEFAVTRAVAAAVANSLKGGSVSPQEDLSSMPLSGQVSMSGIIDAAMVRYHAAREVQQELPVQDPVPVRELPEPEPVPQSRILPSVYPPSEPEEPEEYADDPDVRTGNLSLTDRDVGKAPYQVRATLPEIPAFYGDWPEVILGVFESAYILCAGKDGLILVDQHAAHERVLFEKILADAEKGDVPVQKLLLPKMLELSRSEADYLIRRRKLFAELGFDLESAGGNTILVNSIPAGFNGCRDPEEMIPEMLEELLERSEISLGAADMAAAARAACKAAIKAHDPKSTEELTQLLRDLKACRQGTMCPHGRPTMITLTRREIERRFGRK